MYTSSQYSNIHTVLDLHSDCVRQGRVEITPLSLCQLETEAQKGKMLSSQWQIYGQTLSVVSLTSEFMFFLSLCSFEGQELLSE